MKKIISALTFVVLVSLPISAQTQDGRLTGSVRDEPGAVVPGAEVSVQGSDATFRFTTERDGAFRFLNLAPGTYHVTAALSGFRSVTRDVVIALGKNVELPIVLKIEYQESITVTAASPILDPTATSTSTTFSKDELANVPTSRDPFALVRTVPGVLLDRVNIGGNETGQAPSVVSKGTRPQDTVYTLDGVVITDMAAAGAPPTYLNFDNFEEVQVATAGQDIKQQTGGVGINLVTKRGTNQFHGNARAAFANDALEASNVPAELKALSTPVTPATADHNKQI